MKGYLRLSVVLALLGLALRCHATKQKYDFPVRTSNRFGIRLHQLFGSDNEHKDDNIVFSPVSLSMALGMIRLGTRGNTSKQIDEVLDWTPTNRMNVHSGFRHLRKRLTSAKFTTKNGYEMTIANRIWAADGLRILDKVKNDTRQYYGAGIATSDFTNRARNKINTWVEDRTRGKIRDLIPAGLLDSRLTKMVVVNAMYFNGTWQTRFETSLSAEFTTSNKTTVKVQMMKIPNAEFKYFEDSRAKCQILELPYKDNKASMVVVLPRKGKKFNIDRLERKLTYEKMSHWMQSLVRINMTVFLPKFRLSQDLKVKSFLQEMGIVDLFDRDQADLSGITGTKELFVKHFLHKAFVDVNEKGTEAAAATGLVMEGRSLQLKKPVFKANRPFLFFVRHKITNAILLMGRVKNPIG